MRTPSPHELLDAWDDGAGLARPERPEPLLRRAAGLGHAEIEALPLGQWSRLLIQVRQRLFGDRIRTVVECPRCGLALEVVLAASTLLVAADGPEVVEASRDGFRVRCREPRAVDLADAAAAPSEADARTLLVSRSVLSAVREGVEVDPTGLPDAVVGAVAEALAGAHPLLAVELTMTCEQCGTSWSRPFDVGAYLWDELDAWAVRLLDDVHVLASAYGWGESDVLALSPTRRRHYLDLVGHG